MSRHFIILIILTFSGLNSLSQERKVYDEGYLVKKGDMAPDSTMHEADGKSYRLSDLKGKVVMLQFPASWCSVCRAEMPFIENEIWKEKKDAGLVVIGIDRDEPVEKVIFAKLTAK